MEFEKPQLPEIHLFPKLEKVGHAIAGLFTQMHHEGSSDHFREHPLDTPVEPVTNANWPNQQLPLSYDSEGCYLEREA